MPLGGRSVGVRLVSLPVFRLILLPDCSSHADQLTCLPLRHSFGATKRPTDADTLLPRRLASVVPSIMSQHVCK